MDIKSLIIHHYAMGFPVLFGVINSSQQLSLFCIVTQFTGIYWPFTLPG